MFQQKIISEDIKHLFHLWLFTSFLTTIIINKMIDYSSQKFVDNLISERGSKTVKMNQRVYKNSNTLLRAKKEVVLNYIPQLNIILAWVKENNTSSRFKFTTNSLAITTFNSVEKLTPATSGSISSKTLPSISMKTFISNTKEPDFNNATKYLKFLRQMFD